MLVAFNALVLNVTGNQGNNTDHLNSFQCSSTAAGGAVQPGERQGCRAEHRSGQDGVGAAPLDAGDTVIYTLTFTNNATGATGADAFDIVLLDTLDSNLSCFVGVTVFA